MQNLMVYYKTGGLCKSQVSLNFAHNPLLTSCVKRYFPIGETKKTQQIIRPKFMSRYKYWFFHLWILILPLKKSFANNGGVSLIGVSWKAVRALVIFTLLFLFFRQRSTVYTALSVFSWSLNRSLPMTSMDLLWDVWDLWVSFHQIFDSDFCSGKSWWCLPVSLASKWLKWRSADSDIFLISFNFPQKFSFHFFKKSKTT